MFNCAFLVFVGKLPKEDFGKIYSLFFPNGDATLFAEYVFNIWDQNQDGSIDFKEFIVAINMSRNATLEEKCKWAFKMYDIDGNDYITKREMLCIITVSFISMWDGGTAQWLATGRIRVQNPVTAGFCCMSSSEIYPSSKQKHASLRGGPLILVK